MSTSTWACPACTFLNTTASPLACCAICGTARPGAPRPRPPRRQRQRPQRKNRGPGTPLPAALSKPELARVDKWLRRPRDAEITSWQLGPKTFQLLDGEHRQCFPLGYHCHPHLGVYKGEGYHIFKPVAVVQLPFRAREQLPDAVASALGARAMGPPHSSSSGSLYFVVHDVWQPIPCDRFTCQRSSCVNVAFHTWLFAPPGLDLARAARVDNVRVGIFSASGFAASDHGTKDPLDGPAPMDVLERRVQTLHAGCALSPNNIAVQVTHEEDIATLYSVAALSCHRGRAFYDRCAARAQGKDAKPHEKDGLPGAAAARTSDAAAPVSATTTTDGPSFVVCFHALPTVPEAGAVLARAAAAARDLSHLLELLRDAHKDGAAGAGSLAAGTHGGGGAGSIASGLARVVAALQRMLTLRHGTPSG